MLAGLERICDCVTRRKENINSRTDYHSTRFLNLRRKSRADLVHAYLVFEMEEMKLEVS